MNNLITMCVPILRLFFYFIFNHNEQCNFKKTNYCNLRNPVIFSLYMYMYTVE